MTEDIRAVQQAAFLQSQVACATIEAMGMAAQNSMCMKAGEPPWFGKHEFDSLIDKYGIGHNAALTTLRGQ
jgi:hypothetical protein